MSFLIPSYRYCGPGNPLPNGPPKNRLDEICRQHDYCYEKYDEFTCDDKMIRQIKQMSWTDRTLPYWIVRSAVSLKRKLGISLYPRKKIRLTAEDRTAIQTILQYDDSAPILRNKRHVMIHSENDAEHDAIEQSISEINMAPAKRYKRMANQSDQSERGYKTKILEPVFNLDIPRDASLAQINIIGSNLIALAAPDSVQQYGCHLQYSFPEYPENLQLGTYGPDSVVYTNQIYDINVDTSIHQYIFQPEGNLLSKDPKATDWDKFTGTFATSQGASSTGAEQYNYVHDGYVLPKSKFLNFFMYVVPKSRQKLLGDWIQRNLAGVNDFALTPQGQIKHSLSGISAWQFDDFCDAVRPIFARYHYWEATAVTAKDYLKYKDGDELNRKMRDPRLGSIIEMGTVKNRDFQLFAGTEDMHPTDAYASKMLIGTMGPYSTNIYSYCHLDIMYKKVSVKASELYWRNHQPELGPTMSRGSRIVYGNADWDTRQDFQSRRGQSNVQGVLTASVGTLDIFEGGRLNKKDADTNILLDTTTSSGDWY